MNGVLIVNCKLCANQAFLYISDNCLGNNGQDLDMTELHKLVEMTIGMNNIKIIDTRGIDYFICSCANYTSIQEIKESLMAREHIHKVVS